MTIKKPVKKPTTTQAATPAAEGSEGAAASSAQGGATIASRFKLDAPDPELAKKAAAASAGTKYAVIAGFIALIVAGILAYTLYKHWEFLMPA